MDKNCIACGNSFVITDGDLAFYARVSPEFAGKRYDIPPPQLCPECRLQRRIAYRNQIYVYSHTSSTTGESMFSMFREDAPFPVISNEEWWGDGWDGIDQGRDVDFNRSFFEQFEELRNTVPHRTLSLAQCENSDYCNNNIGLKNCYFHFNGSYAEDCMYNENVLRGKDCIDCSRSPDCELCYDCQMCSGSYNLQSSAFCDDCSDSFFLLNCRSCKHCFGCVNLRHKEYCMFNEQLSKEEYEKRLSELQLQSYAQRQDLKKRCHEFFVQHPRPHALFRQTEAVDGNYVFESKAIESSFFILNGENLKYCFNLDEYSKDCYDFSFFGFHAELLYECTQSGINAFNLRFCHDCWEANSDLLYCWMCSHCEDCFGCVCLKKKRYCIFNKQYTKEEYEALVPKIIELMQTHGEWGEFFPLKLSPHAYNHSMAQRYFPLTKEETQQQGLVWYDKEHIDPKEAIDAAKLPDVLPEGDESLTVKSMQSGRLFRITSLEIKRYRRLNVPLPRKTYDERMEERAKLLGSIRLYDRTCAKTGKDIVTTFEPDSPWVVWDRDAYEMEFNS